jgi:hypothetical protein
MITEILLLGHCSLSLEKLLLIASLNGAEIVVASTYTYQKMHTIAKKHCKFLLKLHI